MSLTESSPLLLQRSTSAPSLHPPKETPVPTLITQALPRFSEPVARDVHKAERQRRHSQKEQRKSNRFRIIELNEVKSWQNHTTEQTPNPASHHVRTSSAPVPVPTVTKRKKKAQYLADEYARLEQQLLKSILINERLRDEVNTNITIAYQKQLLRVPMIGLLRYGKEARFVTDMSQLTSKEYDLEYTKDPSTISKKQLSLDLFHHEREYRTIISVILYLENLKPPLAYVIARYPILVSPKVPDLFIEDDATTTTTTTTVTTTRTTTTTQTTRKNNPLAITSQPSFMERLYLNCTRVSEAGFYYLVYADLSLTTPEPL